jgi:undecaprenyl diphosphate synthase
MGMISHLALIMDGNRRWAKKQGMFAWLGHRQGAKNVEMVMRYCLDRKISYLSLYTFSLENLQRPEQERNYLFLLVKEAQSRVDEFIKADVKIKFIGDLSLVPLETRKICLNIENLTSHCKTLTCHFLFCYGAQQEILAAVNKLVQLGSSNITKDVFKEALWSGNIPDPEIIIRTGGVRRLSNFLLFQAAYSEIRFLDCLWPDLTVEILDQTVQDCLQVQKNFGV